MQYISALPAKWYVCPPPFRRLPTLAPRPLPPPPRPFAWPCYQASGKLGGQIRVPEYESSTKYIYGMSSSRRETWHIGLFVVLCLYSVFVYAFVRMPIQHTKCCISQRLSALATWPQICYVLVRAMRGASDEGMPFYPPDRVRQSPL